MKIAIGCDHGGLILKPTLIEFLEKNNIEYRDFGTYGAESVDYPDYALPVSEAVACGEYDYGILICGTGIGMSIAANKVTGIRCALCHDVFSAKATRLHNNANMLAFGARVIGAGLMLEIVQAFLGTEFEGARHVRRLEKIASIEKKYNGSVK